MSLSRVSDGDRPPRSPSESTEDVVVINFADCINQVVAELNTLKSLVNGFASKLEEREKSIGETLVNGVEKARLSTEGEEKEKSDSPARVTSDGNCDDSSNSAGDGRKPNGLDGSPGDGNIENNNSSAVPNKNEKTLGKERKNLLNQFVNLMAAWRTLDSKVLAELISLMLASEVFVTDTQLNRWKKKQCTEVFYIPMKSGESS